MQVLEQFGDVEPFLQENSDLSPATRSKLLDILHNPQSLTTLELELAAIVDMGVHFVKATYRLEGDGLLILVCYEEILKIRAAIQSAWYPNIQAVAKNAFPSNPSLQSQWAAYAISCVQPGIDYFRKRLGDDQSNPMKAFKAARSLSPFKMNEIQPMAMDIDDLQAFPFLVGDISRLKTELPTYLAQAADVSTGVDTLRRWKDHSEDLPCWSSATKKVFLLQPSSAAAERVFSLLKNTFGDQQQNAQHDYVEAALMLQYNKR